MNWQKLDALMAGLLMVVLAGLVLFVVFGVGACVAHGPLPLTNAN